MQDRGKQFVWGGALLLFLIIILFWFMTFRSTLRAPESNVPAHERQGRVQEEVEKNLQSFQNIFSQLEKTAEEELPKTTELFNRVVTLRLKERLEEKKTNAVRDNSASWMTFSDQAFGFTIQYPDDWKKTSSQSNKFLITDSNGARLVISKGDVPLSSPPDARTRNVTFHGIPAQETYTAGYQEYRFTYQQKPWVVRYTYSKDQEKYYDELWRTMNATFSFL